MNINSLLKKRQPLKRQDLPAQVIHALREAQGLLMLSQCIGQRMGDLE